MENYNQAETSEIEIVNPSTGEVVDFGVTNAVLAQIKQKFLALIVKDFDDKVGYVACSDAKKELVKLRNTVEERRKEYKKDALEYGRMLDAEASRVTAEIQHIEKHLQKQKDIVDEEIKRIAREKIQKRVSLLNEVKAVYNPAWLEKFSDKEFEEFYLKEEARFNQEEEIRLAKEKELEELRIKDAENKRIAAQAEAENRRLREEQQKRDAELIAKAQAELAEANRKLEEHRKITEEKERAEANALRAAETERLVKEKAEAEKKAKAEEDARNKARDKKLFDSVKAEFPTIEACWLEIVKLKKLQGAA